MSTNHDYPYAIRNDMEAANYRLDIVSTVDGVAHTVLHNVGDLDLDNPEDPSDRLELISAVSNMLSVLDESNDRTE